MIKKLKYLSLGLFLISPLLYAQSAIIRGEFAPGDYRNIPVDSSNYLYVNCPGCTGATAPTGLNNTDAIPSVATGLVGGVNFLYGYNGTTWDRLQVDGSKFLKVISQTGSTTVVTGTVAVTQSGTWTVQPGNTANTTAWKVDGSAVTQPISGAINIASTTTGGCTSYHLANGTAASTNSTSIKGSAGTLCHLMVINTTATLYYLKLYNLSSAPTCSSATGLVHVYPIPASATGAGFSIPMPFGEAYGTGIGFCVTASGADTSNDNAATGVYVEAGYK